MCLEFAETGPLAVCLKCTMYYCATSRYKISEGKSLLAVTVLENIEHRCKNRGCDKMMPLAEVEGHKEKCEFRLTVCPSWLCGQKIAFCHIIDHLLGQCLYSYSNGEKILEIDEMPYGQTFGGGEDEEDGEDDNHYDVDTFLWDEKYFFLNMSKGSRVSPAWNFSIEMLGTERECSDYAVELTVYSPEEENGGKKIGYKFTGTPCAVEEEKEMKKSTGLSISDTIMRKLLSAQLDFCISVEFYKK